MVRLCDLVRNGITLNPILFTVFQRRSFIKNLLDPDPTTRLGGKPDSCEDVKSHDWLKDTDWHSASNKSLQVSFLMSKEVEQRFLVPLKDFF